MSAQHACYCRVCNPCAYPVYRGAEGHVRARDQYRDGFHYRVWFCGSDVSSVCVEAVSGPDALTGCVVLYIPIDRHFYPLDAPPAGQPRSHRCRCGSGEPCQWVFSGETVIRGYPSREAWEAAAPERWRD